MESKKFEQSVNELVNKGESIQFEPIVNHLPKVEDLSQSKLSLESLAKLQNTNPENFNGEPTTKIIAIIVATIITLLYSHGIVSAFGVFPNKLMVMKLGDMEIIKKTINEQGIVISFDDEKFLAMVQQLVDRIFSDKMDSKL
jgi:hypothetical protein